MSYLIPRSHFERLGIDIDSILQPNDSINTRSVILNIPLGHDGLPDFTALNKTIEKMFTMDDINGS